MDKKNTRAAKEIEKKDEEREEDEKEEAVKKDTNADTTPKHRRRKGEGVGSRTRIGAL